MRNAAHRRHDEAPQEPPPRDLAAEAGELMDLAAALLPLLEANADMRAVNETVILGLRLAELASAMEDAAAGESVVSAAYAQGRADEAAAAKAARTPGPRHAGRRRHLMPVPGIPATAVRAAAASIVVASLGSAAVAGMHDESAVRPVAASPAGHAALRPMAPDRAVVIPSPRWSPSPRPSVAAATASPVPAVTPSPSPSPPAPAPSVPLPPPVTVPAGPVLVAPSLLDLGGSHFGHLPLSVDGPGEVAWTATTTDGITLQQSAGVVVSGQPVEVQVDDPTGDGGWVYFWAGSQALAVHVMPFGAPAVALP